MVANSPSGIGVSTQRVDGVLKVTGRATYAAEPPMPNMAYGVLVGSPVAAGKLKSIDTAAATNAPGVLAVLTPSNIPKLTKPQSNFFVGGVLGEERMPLSDDAIYYAGQYVAIVVADTFEQATHAAELLKIDIAADKPLSTLTDAAAREELPKESFGEPVQLVRGSADMPVGANRIDVTYVSPMEHHNPMELSATVARWEEDRLTVWDATQFITGTQAVLAESFGIPRNNVRVLCPFVGGAFGCKGFQWPHTILAAVAAKVANRPVKVMLTRGQMFSGCGHRPAITQTMSVAADPSGQLQAVRHDTLHHDSIIGAYVEPAASRATALMYTLPNLQAKHAVKHVNLPTPTPMRAPGETPGMWALESAIDELAVSLNMDPIALRLKNYADNHPGTGKPWSGKNLKDAYTLGVEKFGWAKRDPKPGSMKNAAGQTIGWGVAGATYPGYRFPAMARIRLLADAKTGVRVEAGSATHDLGTGAYTAFTQITASAVGLPIEQVKFELGDSTLPPAPVAGGSNSTASVGQAISDAAAALKTPLLAAAGDSSPLKGLKATDVDFVGGALVSKTDPSKKETLADLLARSGQPSMVGTSAVPGLKGPAAPGPAPAEGSGEYYTSIREKYAFQSFGCHFVEVTVDPMKTAVRVSRVVSVIDNGRIINPLTAGSQVIGGVIMGIGMAMMEETSIDPRFGRPINPSLENYAVCVNADIPNIEPYFVDKPDVNIGAQGARGVGEIGITGVAAAVANAIYHATGKRFRDLPITVDKLFEQGVFA